MRHTDFYKAINIIERLAIQELKAALVATGGTFVPDSEAQDDIIVVGAFKHSPGSMDILVTKVSLEDGDSLMIYGKPYQYQELPEQPVCFMEAGYYGYIINAIPETERVRSVVDASRNSKAYESLSEILNEEF